MLILTKKLEDIHWHAANLSVVLTIEIGVLLIFSLVLQAEKNSGDILVWGIVSLIAYGLSKIVTVALVNSALSFDVNKGDFVGGLNGGDIHPFREMLSEEEVVKRYRTLRAEIFKWRDVKVQAKEQISALTTSLIEFSHDPIVYINE